MVGAIPPLTRWWIAAPCFFLAVFALVAFLADLTAYLPCVLCNIHAGIVGIFVLVMMLYFVVHVSMSDLGVSFGVPLRSIHRAIYYTYATVRGTAVDAEKQYAPLVNAILIEGGTVLLLAATIFADHIYFGNLACMLLPIVTIPCIGIHAFVGFYILRKRETTILPLANMDETALPGP